MNGLSSVLLIITCTNVDLFLIVPLDTILVWNFNQNSSFIIDSTLDFDFAISQETHLPGPKEKTQTSHQSLGKSRHKWQNLS